MVDAAMRHVETSVRAAIDLAGSVIWVVFRDGRDSAVMNHVRSVTMSLTKSFTCVCSVTFFFISMIDV